MKKFFVLFLAILFVSVSACKNPFFKNMLDKDSGSEGSGDWNSQSSDVGSFEDAGDFVKIIPPVNGIIGVAPGCTLPGTGEHWKGVFIAGRTVKLSPYKIGKMEVTYELCIVYSNGILIMVRDTSLPIREEKAVMVLMEPPLQRQEKKSL